MELICEQEIWDSPSAQAQCKENVRFSLVRQFGNRFLDADLFTPGIQREGPRSNA